jgi:hypothetical protein
MRATGTAVTVVSFTAWTQRLEAEAGFRVQGLGVRV